MIHCDEKNAGKITWQCNKESLVHASLYSIYDPYTPTSTQVQLSSPPQQPHSASFVHSLIEAHPRTSVPLLLTLKPFNTRRWLLRMGWPCNMPMPALQAPPPETRGELARKALPQ